jgi:hypothetical protein
VARYWFRQKRFGYGATPNTWQGWMFTLGCVALVIGMTICVQKFVADPHTRVIAQLAGIAIILIPFCWICYVKTEGGWRWRS